MEPKEVYQRSNSTFKLVESRGEASLCRGRAASGRNLAQEFEIDSALIISRPNEQTIERKREIESILETWRKTEMRAILLFFHIGT